MVARRNRTPSPPAGLRRPPTACTTTCRAPGGEGPGAHEGRPSRPLKGPCLGRCRPQLPRNAGGEGLESAPLALPTRPGRPGMGRAAASRSLPALPSEGGGSRGHGCGLSQCGRPEVPSRDQWLQCNEYSFIHFIFIPWNIIVRAIKKKW